MNRRGACQCRCRQAPVLVIDSLTAPSKEHLDCVKPTVIPGPLELILKIVTSKYLTLFWAKQKRYVQVTRTLRHKQHKQREEISLSLMYPEIAQRLSALDSEKCLMRSPVKHTDKSVTVRILAAPKGIQRISQHSRSRWMFVEPQRGADAARGSITDARRGADQQR